MRVGINGFGRIGRQVFRIAEGDERIEVVHVNDVADAATLAHLLQFDTTYGPWSRSVRANERALFVGDRRLRLGSDVKEFKKASTETKDPDLRAWAAKTLPVLEKHLELAKELNGRTKG